MEAINSIVIEIPVIQIVLLLALSTVFLLFRRDKLALLTNYVFVLYWGYVFNQDVLFGLFGSNLNYFIAFYFGFGLTVSFLAIFSFMTSEGVIFSR